MFFLVGTAALTAACASEPSAEAVPEPRPASGQAPPDAGGTGSQVTPPMQPQAEAPPPAAPLSPFRCDPSQSTPERALRRLSSAQYQQRLHQLVELLVPEHTQAVLSEVANVMGALPADLRSGPGPEYGGLRRLDQSIYADAVDATHALAVALGAALTSPAERLDTAAGTCAVDADPGNDRDCVDGFIRRLGGAAWGRPLSDDDLAFYRALVQDSPVSAADYADIVAVLLSSPFFLYTVELGEPGSRPHGTVALTAHELAARLSLHFWQSGPDPALLAAADSGALLDPHAYEAEVERVYADARTERMLRALFVEWLAPRHLQDLHLQVGSADYDALRGEFTPGPELKARMLAELGSMGVYYAHRTDSTFADMFESRHAFPETADLAEIYGVPVWDGQGAPPTFPEPERVGLLTRAALVATGHASPHPIFKGVFARKAVLCDDIPPPPADANAVAMGVLADGLTSRALTEALSTARSDCAGCHATLINPIGFTLEHFDGLGRFRTIERVLDPFGGVVLAEEPVDSVAVPRVLPDDERQARGPADLHRFMLESGKPQACFVRRYFRHTFARVEDDARDGCVLDGLLQALLAGDSLGSVLRSVALRPEFRHRSYAP